MNPAVEGGEVPDEYGVINEQNSFSGRHLTKKGKNSMTMVLTRQFCNLGLAFSGGLLLVSSLFLFFHIESSFIVLY